MTRFPQTVKAWRGLRIAWHDWRAVEAERRVLRHKIMAVRLRMAASKAELLEEAERTAGA